MNGSRRALVAAILCAAGMAHAQTQVRLAYATFDPLLSTPPIPGALAAVRDSRLFLIQFNTTPTEADRELLRALGATIQRFLTDNTHVITLDPAAAPKAAALPGVRWIGPYHPAYRISADCLSAADVPGRYSIEALERGPAAQSRIAGRIRALGGITHFTTPEGFRMEATLTRDQLLAVAHLDDVNYIDPVGEPGADMDIVRQLTGAVPILSTAGFTGQGVRGCILDTGVDVTHPDLQNPPPLIQCAPTTASMQHGTAVFGITFGTGASNPLATGMLPSREQGVFCYFGALSTFGGATSPYAAAAELVDPAGPYRCVFQARAVGSAQISAYTTISAEFDDIFFLHDLLISQAQGYETASNNCRPQAWAKNVLSVGGVMHQNTLTRDDDAGGWASVAADGRVKPDLAAVRDNVLTVTPGSYTTFSGTSAATGIMAGCAGLVFQMWHLQVWPGHGGVEPTVFADRPRHSTARALLVNSAYQYNWPQGGPNGNITRGAQGWGMPDLAALYNSRNSTFIVSESDPILPLGTRSYTLTVNAGEPALKATMVYLDPRGNPAAAHARINDLTLKVISPEQVVYWGNHGLASGIWSTPSTSPDDADTVNIVENVFIENPAAGAWTIQVLGSQIVQDARLETPELDADFSLIVRGISFPCYANCDGSTITPILNIQDFSCFINKFAAGESYANCDNSTIPPVLNVQDFACFLNRFGAGCP